ncbi:type III pantothenate kinase [Gemmiger formicilis]|nr:type III pantothenate kinase [Gemmiger formicilis]
MILALNIGNSNITFGGYTPDGKLVFSSRLFADTALSSDELLYKIVNMLALYGAEPQQITAVIFSSVVPALTPRLREALHKMCECQIMEVGPGLKSGVRIRMDNPAQLGGELLCAIVGALQRCTPPCVVVNFDTATTLLAVDSTGALVGGSILPGPQCSLSALVRNTAQLPQVELEARPRRLLGPTRRTVCTAALCTARRPCWTAWSRRSAQRWAHPTRRWSQPARCPTVCARRVRRILCTARRWCWKGCIGSGRRIRGSDVLVAGHPCRGGVLDAPRRGQDPSLRCGRSVGGYGKRAGRACPAYGWWMVGGCWPGGAGRRIVISVFGQTSFYIQRGAARASFFFVVSCYNILCIVMYKIYRERYLFITYAAFEKL